MPVEEPTARAGRPYQRLERMVRRAQADGRVPAVSAALHRADRPLWTFQVGGTGNESPLDADTRFRIGSVTKTFTAVLIMQCRDDGLLGLDDPLGRHLELPAHGDLTIRNLLSHTSGLQREPFGDVWDTLRPPDVRQLLAELDRAEQVLPPGRRFHYSNLAFSLLGHLVGSLRGGTWEEVLADRILVPLGLSATTMEPTGRAATGFLVDAYSDHARPEPPTDFSAIGPAGQLWGTAGDLARWAAFLADPAAVDPDGTVLRAESVDEMRWPLTVTDEAQWTGGIGLGLMLEPQPGRVLHVGHYGGMPGFLAAVFGRRGGEGTPAALGCAVLGSAGNGESVLDLVHTLLARAVELDPADIEPWRPGEPAPDGYRSVLGRWWGEGFPYDFHWRGGRLEAHMVGVPAGRPPAVFEPVGADPDVLRTVSGREVGELLRLTRDATGTVVRMHWATYRFTRWQETFDGVPASEP